MRTQLPWLAALLLLCLLGTPSLAAVPQTIVIDGVNDFDLSNAIDADSADTQFADFCTNDPELESPLDIGTVFVTNDAANLYVGFYYDKDCFQDPAVNLGLAIDLGDAAGGTTDPFGRSIGWAGLTNKPDYIVYDVLKSITDNFEVLYQWNGVDAWNDVTSIVNGIGSGNNALGIVEFGTNFVEFKLPLCSLIPGLDPGTTQINLEWWMTQDSPTKGPLDAVASDDVQMSRAVGTMWDTTDVVQMTTMLPYTIQAVVDNDPPNVASACATEFAILGNGTFALTTTRIDVLFDEAVEALTAGNVANYDLTDPVNGFNFISAATRDPVNCNQVHLTLGIPITADASFFDVTVTGVKDLAGNTIVNNGTDNVGSFFIQNVTFDGNMALGLCSGIFAPSDDFSIEGNVLPLTFDPLCDNAKMYDVDADSIYSTTVPFCYSKNAVTGKGEASLEWKMVHACTTFEEALPSNRMALLSSDNGANYTLSVAWNDIEPGDLTASPVDVVFQVDANPFAPVALDTINLHGNQPPLSFDLNQGIMMVDDGSGQDLAAGDGIYTATVRFGECSAKDVKWKVAFNDVFECFEQGDREVFVNDAAFDTVGGANGELWLPARDIDRCTTSDKQVAVIFQLDATALQFFLMPGDTVEVRGNISPLSFEGDPDPSTIMVDDGTGDDAVAGDNIYTATVVFPDSSNLWVEYKYRAGGMYECPGVGNRNFKIDDVAYSVGTPQVRPVNTWGYCEDDLVSVADPVNTGSGRLVLYQNTPNPFRGSTTIRFETSQRAPVSLSVYNVAGRKVTTLVNGYMEAGPHSVSWDRQDATGARVPSGVYFYELRVGGQKSNKVMVILQ
jgi:hypothetical protein